MNAGTTSIINHTIKRIRPIDVRNRHNIDRMLHTITTTTQDNSLIYNQQTRQQHHQLSSQICYYNLTSCSCSSCSSNSIMKMKKTNSLVRYYASSSSSSSSSDNNSSTDSNTRIKTIPLSNISKNDTKLVFNELSKEENVNESNNDKSVNDNNTNNDTTTTTSPLDNIPGTGKSGKKILAMVYTCAKCNTRSAKKFTEQAYTKGVVLIKCPNCESLHLIADNLGMFGESHWNIEGYLKKHGGDVTVINEDNVLEFTKHL